MINKKINEIGNHFGMFEEEVLRQNGQYWESPDMRRQKKAFETEGL